MTLPPESSAPTDPPIAPPAIEARELYRFYHVGDDETQALRGVSMEVNAGEIVAVVGPSGSGKSTLMACLAGLDEPDGGFVYINGERLTRRDEKTRTSLRARSIGILLQSGNLFDHLTVRQNVRLKMHLARQIDDARISEVLDLVGISKRSHAYPAHLSGGEAARAGLAVALASRPPFSLPTSRPARSTPRRSSGSSLCSSSTVSTAARSSSSPTATRSPSARTASYASRTERSPNERPRFHE